MCLLLLPCVGNAGQHTQKGEPRPLTLTLYKTINFKWVEDPVVKPETRKKALQDTGVGKGVGVLSRTPGV